MPGNDHPTDRFTWLLFFSAVYALLRAYGAETIRDCAAAAKRPHRTEADDAVGCRQRPSRAANRHYTCAVYSYADVCEGSIVRAYA